MNEAAHPYYRPAPNVTEAENNALRERIQSLEKQLAEYRFALDKALRETVRITKAAEGTAGLWEYDILTYNPGSVVRSLNKRAESGWELVQHISDTTPSGFLWLRRLRRK